MHVEKSLQYEVVVELSAYVPGFLSIVKTCSQTK